MSFGKPDGAEGVPQFKKFVTQDEIDEQRKKRQEEWEKVRKPDQPLEAPEEVHDPRSLYEKLEQQKQQKQDDYDAQFKMINQVKGLDEGEANFLNEVADKQAKVQQSLRKEEEDAIQEYKSNLAAQVTEASCAAEATGKASTTQMATRNRKSQMQLLAGAVKRKRSPSKSPSESNEKQSKAKDEKHCDSSDDDGDIPDQVCNVARVLGVLPGVALPGVGEYSDTSDSASTSSESDIDTSSLKHIQVKVSASRHSNS